MRFLIASVLLVGCATSPGTAAAGPPAQSVSQEAQLCGDVRGLHAGDPVELQRRVCKTLTPKSAVIRCAMEDIDRAEVLRVDGSCATVRVTAGVALQPGDTWAPANAQLSAADR